MHKTSIADDVGGNSSMQEFRDFLQYQLLKEFCSPEKPDLTPDGFVAEWGRIAPEDAQDFLRAFASNLIEHKGSGLYRALRSHASEQFFWSGLKGNRPRKITIWTEPIITVALLARLHHDLKWPSHLLGTQSAKWGFDLCAYSDQGDLTGSKEAVIIACEVKKSVGETKRLIGLMKEFGARASGNIEPTQRDAKNAYRKVQELRAIRPQFFWAVGPGRLSCPYRVVFHDDERFELCETEEGSLTYSSTGVSEQRSAEFAKGL